MPVFDPAPAGPFRVEATRVLSAGLGVRVRRVLLVLVSLCILLAACHPATGAAPAAGTAAPAPPVDARTEMWLRLGRCEQPDRTGTEWGGVNWTEQGPRYEGGLGFAAATWDEARDAIAHNYLWLDPNMGNVPPDVQIAAAEYILARYGPGAWGCAGDAGLHL